MSHVSTWMGDRLGIHGAVDILHTTDKPGIVLDSCEPLLLHYVKKTELNRQISGYFQVKRAKYS